MIPIGDKSRDSICMRIHRKNLLEDSHKKLLKISSEGTLEGILEGFPGSQEELPEDLQNKLYVDV